MAIYDLYSKRQKRLKGETPEIFVYDQIEKKLRYQIVLIFRDAVGSDSDYSNKFYNWITETLCREYGVRSLHEKTFTYHNNIGLEKDFFTFIEHHAGIEELFDAIELTMRYIDIIIRKDNNYGYNVKVKLSVDDAIIEFNDRLRESGVGYSYINRQIIKLDSTVMHQEIAEPVIKLLWQPAFEYAAEEYLKAQQHYKEGRNKECLNDCLKAFESTMKIICHTKGWAFEENDPAKKLIAVCLNNNLIPEYIQTQFSSLKGVLESGVPTIRNKEGAHGQGHIKKEADDELTRYALNLTGANIIYLVEQSGIK